MTDKSKKVEAAAPAQKGLARAAAHRVDWGQHSPRLRHWRPSQWFCVTGEPGRHSLSRDSVSPGPLPVCDHPSSRARRLQEEGVPNPQVWFFVTGGEFALT